MPKSLQVTEREGYFYDTGRSFIWIFDSMQFTGYEREKSKNGSLILVCYTWIGDTSCNISAIPV